ncbi:molybdate ABC transporter substrate-binding protein [Cyclobacterium jeungdonense]|uniref:Molybdate ABC transporter substrate-binding protein n=1 Tax=Cyclobacterium jeungdonense TaxID=708087 RepID=A0ABT8C5A4_9BACT|nr:molybdate ABC transporter substrate-binding protein [Cyclobacterium jeungdonense]MDN3687650.1 molybdate ABC transporter substrate-binding protein [Cyclobacterium jeungdonense]
MKRKGKVIFLFLSFVIFFQSANAHREPPVLVAAASDLKFALDSIILVFNHEKEITVKPIYGSSGKLYEQLSNRAPFHIFMSADVRYPELLAEKGMTASEIYLYGVGRLVVWSKKYDVKDLGMEAFQQSWVRKIAIANPDHAPYGKRAVESLAFYGLYERLAPLFVKGENISQAAQFVSTGAADLGIIALSLALSPAMKKLQKSYFLIPESSHSPLVQGAVVTSHGESSPESYAFMEFLKGEKAIGIFRYFGFSQPSI